MKKKLISILIVTILELNALLCNAVNISFENLDSSNNMTENNFLQDNNTPFEVTTLNNKEDKKNMTQNINLLSQNNLDYQQPYINNNVLNNLNYTTIDLTDLVTGEVITHDCNLYLATNFDENNHWQECSICGKIINLVPHNYVDNGWSMETSDDCSETNNHQFICNCGASYNTTEGRKKHNWIGPEAYPAQNYCVYRCTNCHEINKIHECIKSDGSRINCGNPGKCALCGFNYPAYHIGRVYRYNLTNNQTSEDVYCDTCSKYMGTISDISTIYNEDNTWSISCKLNVNGNYSALNSGSSSQQSQNINIFNNNKNVLFLTAKFKYIKYTEYSSSICQSFDYVQNGEKHRIAVWRYNILPDYIAPIITNIQSNINNSDWSNNSNINITGTENYCKSVIITLKDMNDNVYFENISIPVTNKNWNYEVKPNIETKENTEFILTVKDTLDNETTQSFYLSKIDNKPPINIGDKETFTNWSKTKDYIVTTTDYGIGQISTSVNGTENYELATEEDNIFYKGYTFTGDVYGSVPVAIYSKDGLGNTLTEFIKVYNLDNTSPTIENVVFDKSLHNTNITIQANDINTKLNAEGSGIIGYAITTDDIEPTKYQESNSFNITEQGTYYLWVKDFVGNVTSKEMEIPVQYKVTINPDGGTWKGSTDSQKIILSSDEKYDLSPIPEKEGYAFTEWKVTGEGYITGDGKLIVTGSDVEVIPIWENNQYSVTYIDYDLTHNQTLNQTIRQVDYNTIIRGFDLGGDTSDNIYYNQYRLVSDTENKVTTSNNTVYRYFEFCYTEKFSHIDFNDNDNIDNLRPETYKLQLQLENGTIIDEVTLSSDVADYTFTELPKYDENGKEYIYIIIPVISDRYKVTPNPETGEPEISYISPEYSILIPKLTTLNGKTGDLSYTLKINSTLFYDDKIIITPDDAFLLTDGISTLSANIVQSKITFTKEDITNNQLTVNGNIQVNRKHFAGTWTGVFNFYIKYEIKN